MAEDRVEATRRPGRRAVRIVAAAWLLPLRPGKSARSGPCPCKQVYRSQLQVGQELLNLGGGYIILIILGIEK